MVDDSVLLPPSTWMRAECLDIPAVAQRVLSGDNAAAWERLRQERLQAPVQGVLTLARGSSDHAAAFVAQALMAQLGVPVLSLSPSVLTVFDAPLRLQGWLGLGVSQSGQSPDLVRAVERLDAVGACTVAWVNAIDSPLAWAARHRIDLLAGPERSVAATKSCVAQMVTGLRWLCEWMRAQGHPATDPWMAAVRHVPALLHAATECTWPAAEEALLGCERMFVVGRGPGLAVAQEAALKLKECCGIQAEAFSSAEVRHGPMALTGAGFVVMVLAPRGPTQAELLQLADELRQRGARVLVAAPVGTPGSTCPLASSAGQHTGDAHKGSALTDPVPWLDALAVLPSHYLMVERLARLRGLDPDQPPHLSKVTRTV